MLTLVIARCLWHKTCQCECEKCLFNRAQRDKTLLLNKDTNAATNTLTMLKTETSVSKVLDNF